MTAKISPSYVWENNASGFLSISERWLALQNIWIYVVRLWIKRFCDHWRAYRWLKAVSNSGHTPQFQEETEEILRLAPFLFVRRWFYEDLTCCEQSDNVEREHRRTTHGTEAHVANWNNGVHTSELATISSGKFFCIVIDSHVIPTLPSTGLAYISSSPSNFRKLLDSIRGQATHMPSLQVYWEVSIDL